MDHYQTPSEVHVSVFAKKADQGTSTVTIEETQVRSRPRRARSRPRAAETSSCPRFTSTFISLPPSGSAGASSYLVLSTRQHRHTNSLAQRFIQDFYTARSTPFDSITRSR